MMTHWKKAPSVRQESAKAERKTHSDESGNSNNTQPPFVPSVNRTHRRNLYAFLFIALCAAGIAAMAIRISPIAFDSRQQRDLPEYDMPLERHTVSGGHANASSEGDRVLNSKPKRQAPSQGRTDTGARQPTHKPLNIVLLYADDWSFTSLGANGNDYIQTPRLDRMAEEGALFTHSCVTTSICMVSRATLYTGQYASKHRTFMSYDNLTMYEGDNWQHALYPQLKKAGYHVGFFGKWHHHDPPKHVPTFDKRAFYQNSHYKSRDGVVRHITEWNEIDGISYLRERPTNQPFMLTVSFFATHAEDGSKEQYRPMNSSMWLYANSEVPHPKTFTDNHLQRLPPFLSSKKNFGRGRALKRYYPETTYQKMMKNTYQMATEVDTVCRRIMDKLERQGVLDKTLMIFTTGQHGLAEKWYAFEESLRVPLIVRDPRMPAGSRGSKISEFALNIDLAPTILAAAQVDVPEQMQGRDLAPLYTDPSTTKATWRTEFFYEWIGGKGYLPTNFALVRKDRKYMYWPQYELEQLFDLESDPYEEDDLNARNGTLMQEQMSAMEEMRRRMGELQKLAAAGVKL